MRDSSISALKQIKSSEGVFTLSKRGPKYNPYSKRSAGATRGYLTGTLTVLWLPKSLTIETTAKLNIQNPSLFGSFLTSPITSVRRITDSLWMVLTLNSVYLLEKER